MKAITAGHLANNGGIRGHSAGSIFPWRVLIQGTLDNLNYWVINPKGDKVGNAWGTYAGALAAAELSIDGYINA